MSDNTKKGNATDISTEAKHVEQEENWSRFSFVLHIFLPVAGLALLFKQKHLFSRLLLQLDRNCVSVLCPSFSRREKLLKWAGDRLPETWSSHSRTLSGGVAELWSDGSLLCTLINSAIPGACPNPYRHWKKPPLHAQALAYKYLGIIPVFTESDLSVNLTVILERNFLHYLDELQESIIKQTEKNELTKSISNYYIARGMGLYSGEQHKKTVFYVYSNIKNTNGVNSNIIIHIRGPYGTYGKAVIPKFHSDLFTIPEINVTSESLMTRKLLQKNCKDPRNNFLKSFSLPFMQYKKKHMGDNIVIDVTLEDDRAKVTYIPNNYGIYEINMIANGELIRGCPFNVHILNNTSGVEENFENLRKVEEIPCIKKRKVISKTIDFIDEQMPMADVFRRYKISNDKNNKKVDEINVNEVSNNHNFNDQEVDDITKNSSPFTNVDMCKSDFLSNIPLTVNKNTINCGVQEHCYKQEIFKLRHNEKKINEAEDNLVSQIQDTANSNKNEANILKDITDDNFNIFGMQNTEFVIENHNPNLSKENSIVSETNIHNNMPEDDYINILEEQNSRFVTENHNYNLFDDNKIIPNTNVCNNVSKDEHFNIFERQNSEFVNEDYNAALKDDDKVITKRNFNKNGIDDILEKQNSESVVETRNYNLDGAKNVISKTDIYNNVPNHDHSTNLDSVNEKESLLSTDESKKKQEHIIKENKQKGDIICKANDYNDTISTHVNKEILTPNKIEIASTMLCEDNELINVQNKQQCNLDNESSMRKTKLTLNEYPVKFSVSKIQIPEKFCTDQNFSKANIDTGLDTKYFKNVINNCNKKELPRRNSTILQENYLKRVTKIVKSEHSLLKTNALMNANETDIECEDINNNKKVIDNLEHSEVKQNLVNALSRKNSMVDIEKINALPRRFFQTQVPTKENPKPKSPLLKTQGSTSAICPDHIVPEVENEYRQMSVAEKRKIFTKQAPVNISDSTNSSFSENENAEGSKRHFRQFEGLSVLNYLGSLKQSQNSKKPENYSLYGTISLPNINSLESEYIFQNSVKARKNFWEQMSSSSSSLNTNVELRQKKTPRKLTEHERCKLIWKKPNEAVLNTNASLEETPDLAKNYKSADDILSITNCIPYQSQKKYKSLDNSLDNCTMLSIEERKKMLLKQNYERERMEREKLSPSRKNSIKKSFKKNINKVIAERIEENKNDMFIFSPILEKIKKYDSGFNLTKNTKEEEIKVSNNIINKSSYTSDISKNYIHNDLQDLPPPQKTKIKSHFKRAISYFKNLEEKSLGKTKSKPLKKDCRRYSLDIQPNKNKNNKIGGSLNLPNVSERFSINNLYNDVFGNRKGSFKGAANQSALVEALATFSRKENSNFNEADEDDIKYNIFKRKAKSKKRRSVRSIFDVYY